MKKYFMLALPILVSSVQAQEVTTLSPIQAESNALQTFAVTAEEAKQAVQRTPGGINIIQPQEIKGSTHTLTDILRGQPGITTVDFFGGNDNPLISIRGSGLSGAPPDRGILYLEQGLPVNHADGTIYPGALSPRNAQAIIVRRGANALNPGLDAFGGEIDFYHQNGHTETGSLSLQGGSYGSANARAALGGVSGNWDYHLSAESSRSDGFRYHNNQYRHAGRLNIGYQNGNFENRTILSYANQFFQIPGPQTLDQLYADPRSVANAGSLPDYVIWATDPTRKNKTWRLANISSWQSANVNHSFGVYYQKTADYFKAPPRLLFTDSRTYGAQYKVETTLDNVTLGAALAYAHMDTDKSANIRSAFINAHRNSGTPMGMRIANMFSKIPPSSLNGKTANLSAQLFADWQIDEQWSLQGQLRYVKTTRDFELAKDGMKKSYSWLSPRLGISYKPSEHHQLFANISTHREVPTMDSYLSSTTPMRLNKDIESQRATSFEIGARGQLGTNYTYDVALYRTNLKNEFLTTPDPLDPTSEISSNYQGKTYHQGIELGLGADWALGDGRLKANVVYTLNDFKFRNGSLKGNQLSGVPRHVLLLGLSYETGPWSFGINSRSALGKMVADNANSLYLGGYTIYGARINYQANKNLDFFLQGDNLGNKRYVSWTFSGGVVNPQSLSFLAGYGRNISAGLNFKF